MIIDGHCHVGEGVHQSCAPDELLAEMDRYGIDRAVICPVDRCVAVANREGNDYLLGVCRQHPERFYGFAAANPWFGDQAMEEVRRAIGEGLKGLKLNPKLQGFVLNDPVIFPLVELAGELNLPIFFHTGTMVCAEPFQLAWLARHYPQVNFIMGHSAATDFWNDVVAAAADLPNIYFDTSLHNPSFIGTICQAAGPERVLFGSDYPANPYPIELEKMENAIPDAEDRKIVMGEAMRRLLER